MFWIRTCRRRGKTYPCPLNLIIVLQGVHAFICQKVISACLSRLFWHMSLQMCIVLRCRLHVTCQKVVHRYSPCLRSKNLSHLVRQLWPPVHDRASIAVTRRTTETSSFTVNVVEEKTRTTTLAWVAGSHRDSLRDSLFGRANRIALGVGVKSWSWSLS